MSLMIKEDLETFALYLEDFLSRPKGKVHWENDDRDESYYVVRMSQKDVDNLTNMAAQCRKLSVS